MVSGVERLEDRKESLGAAAKLHAFSLFPALLESIGSALEIAQESRQQLNEAIDLVQVDDSVEKRFQRTRFERCVRPDLLGQGFKQPPFLALVAVRFDQDGFVLFVHPALPFHALQVLASVHPRRRSKELLSATSFLFPNAEMLEVDAAVRQAEVRAIVASRRI